jgi:hypothetical protein
MRASQLSEQESEILDTLFYEPMPGRRQADRRREEREPNQRNQCGKC